MVFKGFKVFNKAMPMFKQAVRSLCYSQKNMLLLWLFSMVLACIFFSPYGTWQSNMISLYLMFSGVAGIVREKHLSSLGFCDAN